MNIGIFGTSANPPHLGHIAVVQAAGDRFKLDLIYCVPTDIQPFKRNANPPSLAHRTKMLSLAVESFKKMIVLPIDKGISYSINTIKKIRAIHPEDNLFFIMGMDSYQSLPRWKKADEICKNVTFIVASRPGYTHQNSVEFEMVNKYGIKPIVLYMNDLKFAVTSTDARRGVYGEVSKNVAEYIEANCLYGKGMEEASENKK